jgi:pyruvate formate lyase activating enzyme
MRISGFKKTTSIDYPGKIACTVFLQGCNFRCGYCHNPELVLNQDKGNYSEEYILKFLEKRKGLLEGVCISGGEPTLQLGLKPFVRKLKERDLPVKLDTNGSNYSILSELRQEKLIDYVAMDVKGPDYLYSKLIGRDYVDFRDDVEKGMVLTTQFPDYEFRTTIVPIDRNNEDISFMKVEEVVDIAKWIFKITGSNKHKYCLQPFVPQKGKLIDSRFEEFPETPRKLLEEMQEKVIKYFPRCRIR